MKEGFRRLALARLVIGVSAGVIVLVVGGGRIFVGYGHDTWADIVAAAFFACVLGVLWHVVIWGIGWIVRGFAGRD